MTTLPNSAEPPASNDPGGSRRTASEPLLSVRVDQGEGQLIVKPEGELDVSTAPLLHEVLLDASSEERFDGIVLDLSALSFVDSTGLSLLVSTNRRMNGFGRVLILLGAQLNVRHVFEVTGLTEVFRMED